MCTSTALVRTISCDEDSIRIDERKQEISAMKLQRLTDSPVVSQTLMFRESAEQSEKAHGIFGPIKMRYSFGYASFEWDIFGVFRRRSPTRAFALPRADGCPVMRNTPNPAMYKGLPTFRAGGVTSCIDDVRADEGTNRKTALTPSYFSHDHFSSSLTNTEGMSIDCG